MDQLFIDTVLKRDPGVIDEHRFVFDFRQAKAHMFADKVGHRTLDHGKGIMAVAIQADEGPGRVPALPGLEPFAKPIVLVRIGEAHGHRVAVEVDGGSFGDTRRFVAEHQPAAVKDVVHNHHRVIPVAEIRANAALTRIVGQQHRLRLGPSGVKAFDIHGL